MNAWDQGAAKTETERPEESIQVARVKVDAQNPWPGADAYDESSSDFFYGRKPESIELLRLIRLAPLTVVYGKSGLGKTSLLQAGLFPMLREQHFLPVPKRVDFEQGMLSTPLDQVKLELKNALDHIKAEYPAMQDGESLWDYLHRKDAEFWSVDNFLLTPVLVFDQFEELFSRTGGNAELIARVFEELADLIENRIPSALANEGARPRRAQLDLLSQRYRILLSFREDFFPDVRSWEKQVPSLLRNYLRLEPMSCERAIEAVEQAGKSVLEAGVAADIVDLVGRGGDEKLTRDADVVIEPVLLSLCCTQLNRRRQAGQLINNELVARAGQDILESFYRTALEDPEVLGPPDAARFIEEYLIQGDRYRGDYPKAEALAEGKLRPAQLKALTDRHRLLRIINRGDTPRIELIHDRLVAVVRKARDERRIKTQQAEQEAKARAAELERDQERARAEDLKRERDHARLSRNLAVLATIACLLILAWGWHQKREGERARLAKEIAVETSRLAEGRGLLQGGSEPLEETMYKALAAYRLSSVNQEMAEAMSPSLSALEGVLDSSGHLAKLIRLPGLMPTPALEYSPDGKTLAVGSEDGRIWLLETDTYNVTGQLLDCRQQGPNIDPVWSLDFSRDGSRLAAAYVGPQGDDAPGRGLVCIFDVKSGSLFKHWSATEHGETGADFDTVAYGGPGNEFVVFGGSDKKLRKWDLNSDNILEIDYPAKIVTVAVSRDGSNLATGGEDKDIRLWHLPSLSAASAPWGILRGHEDIVEQLMFSPTDPNILLSASDDGRVISWDVEHRRIAEQTKRQDVKIYNLAIGSTRLVAAAGEDGYVRLFRVTEGPANRGIGTPAKELDVIPEGTLSGHGGVILGVSWDPQGQHLASAGQDGSIRIWAANVGSFASAQLEGIPGQATSLAINPDGSLVAAGNAEGDISLWKGPFASGEAITVPASSSRWRAHTGQIRAISFARLNGKLVIVSGGDDGVLRLWDVNTKELIRPDLADNAKEIYSLALSPDGKLLAAGSNDGTVRLWDLQTSRIQQKIDPPKSEPEYQLSAVGFSRDGRYLAIGSSWYVDLRIVAAEDPSKQWVLQGHHRGVSHIARGATEWLLSADSDGSVLEWEESALSHPKSSSLRKRDDFAYRSGSSELRPTQPIRSMDASADGKWILTGGDNGKIQLWNGAEHVLISDHFSAGNGTVKLVAMVPDGSYFVTADSGTIRVWPGPSFWADIVCSKLLWNISDNQWRTWISSSPLIPYREQCPNLPKWPS